MPPLVTAGTTIKCSFGAAPTPLNVLPTSGTVAGGMPVATIADMVPFVNIVPFGVCTSLANPTVATATAAALGVLTPMPCVPAPVGPWVPGSPTVLVGGRPALQSTSMCTCAYAGVISVVMPTQVTVQAP
ncbi:MAG: DUF4280 domain-containing protein [Acidimicrobiales bacterium]